LQERAKIAAAHASELQVLASAARIEAIQLQIAAQLDAEDARQAESLPSPTTAQMDARAASLKVAAAQFTSRVEECASSPPRFSSSGDAA